MYKEFLAYVVAAIGCAVVWLVILPIVMLCGVAVAAYAVAEEALDGIVGRPMTRMNQAAARAIAQRMCLTLH